jgi:hypothetical protein
MAEIKNTFLKGKMNQDLDSRIVPNGEYREARNLSISRSEGSTVGEFENVLGNIKISSLGDLNPAAPANTEIIGKFIDDNSSMAYFMATDWNPGDETRAPGTAKCYIVSVDLSSTNPPLVLVQGSFLNFNQGYIITGINLIENQLFWTDNLNQPRKINVALATSNSSHYTTEDQISVAKYAPFEPILAIERVQTTLNGSVTSSATIVVTSSTGIKVGDIVTDKVKLGAQQILELVTVVGIPVANTLTLSKPVTIINTTPLDFSRPSMTNKKDLFMFNHSSGNATIAGTGLSKTYTIKSALPSDVDFLYNGNNGIPKVGDLVTSTTSGIPADTRVASVTVVDNDAATLKQSITVTLNKTTSIADGSFISISDNPDYDANWKGDDNFLEDKFVRFSYRFKFEDNEYSLMAPFSQPMFIPKQYSQFGGGLLSPTEDMDDAYKSTIITWFENNINNILLKIPVMSSTAAGLTSSFKITDIDILYKESDALAVKVLDTVEMANPSPTFSSIAFHDAIHGINTKYFLDYDYSSTKPYKTLPNNQVTRVSDRVPVRALAQEVIGNRIVYGNYLDRHTGPNSIDFSANTSNKSTKFDNYTQYPKHQLKQNRTYQVGFVLSDRYGRQSDVILSSYDNVPGISGSTVFHPYNSLADQTSNTILDWLGDALVVTLNKAVQSTYNPALGTPGIYSADNPLGWYSYKIVVKQTEQEYYNVYLPGFVNGYPVTQNNERNKSFFTTLLGDNVNKIPRNLKEVGPNDRDYGSDESLNIRVNNPLINNKSGAVYPKTKAWNAQYYPSGIEQEVIQIATVRDMEIQAIPFKPNAVSGEYGESAILQTYTYNTPGDATSGVDTVNEVPEPTGRIPWGTTGPDAPLYSADSNPFVMKGNQSENINNPVGAYVTTFSVNAPPSPPTRPVFSMVPFLSVAETNPVESLLDIFWETSLSGNLAELNALVDSQYGGLTSSNFVAAEFFENVTNPTIVGTPFKFKDGAGTEINASLVTINSISIIDADGNAFDPNNLPFTITPNGQNFEIKTNTTFFYNTDVDTSGSGVYIITANTSYTSGAGDFDDSITLPNISLKNSAPVIGSFAQPTGVTTQANQVIIDTLTAVNGSANTSVNTEELKWSLDPIRTDFSINENTGDLTSTEELIDNTLYNVGIKVTDLNGNGLSDTATLTFQVGNPRVNKALCEGWQAGLTTRCESALRVQFFNDAIEVNEQAESVTNDGFTVTYPGVNQSDVYNVLARNPTSVIPPGITPVDNTTGALLQGALFIKPTLTNVGGSAGQDDDIIGFTIQHKPIGSGSWSQAVDSSGFTVYNETLQVGVNDTVFIEKIFDTPGEYKVLSTRISGGQCNLSPQNLSTSFTVEFGDANYVGNPCTDAPL